jgi:hypothetical protein
MPKTLVRMIMPILPAKVRRRVRRRLLAPPSLCSCCGTEARFTRADARCPACGSLAHHRLLALALARGALRPGGGAILHIQPEPVTAALLRGWRPGRYVAAASHDFERSGRADASFDLIACIESPASAGLAARLRPGGTLVAMVADPEACAGLGLSRFAAGEDFAKYRLDPGQALLLARRPVTEESGR